MTFRRTVIACLLSAVLAATVTTYRVKPDSETQTANLNKYEIAQRKTVLVVNPLGSQGSAVTMRRTDSSGNQRWIAWTAAHVVEGADEVIIQTFLKHRLLPAGVISYSARVLARDPRLDLALLEVQAGPDAFLSAQFSPTDPRPGDEVFGCGNFRGRHFVGSVSTGVISQVGVVPGYPDWPWPLCDQTTCVIYPGSSGGPAFDALGRVLGLFVGGFDSTLNVFVPVRAVEQFAQAQGFARSVWEDRFPENLTP